MQVNQTFVRLFLLLLPITAFSQTTYLPQDARENILFERLEIKAGKDSVLNFSKIRPFSRKQAVSRLHYYLDTSFKEMGANRVKKRQGLETGLRSNQISKYLTEVDFYSLAM